ncbi:MULTISPECIES: response regulator transcription factor [Kocuria]|jgi:DNA-binding response OmpR family regulator|uniref:PhoR family transcriptional regulator n=2 Tax=Kocuria TaxID=57493 RepID=A0A2N4T0Y1_9MICC|nr:MULTISPECIES: response regulator transcription factor [Kocuria]KLU08389.1 PhoR family transcriptional regulator [Kocuria sp. SM24M-10]OLT12348.1 DNA-binding response regulator [Kocuria sp. CNJ-770]PLC11884.1 PhoR family transcriptional regulator [Kocuria flava]WJZ68517.1 response regulator transcription factor [Kocuria rosea]
MSIPSPGRVLVVDDEVDLAELVVEYLRKAGLQVAVRHDGNQAVAAVRDFSPDVLVLDLGLPGIDGIEVCRQVRTFSDCHVLMLTARDDEIDKIVGLSVGADDYVTKPFSPRELVARVQAMLRRVRTRPAPAPEPAGQDQALVIGDLVVDEAAREVHLGGEPVALTRIEFDLLLCLATNPQLVLSRRQLVEMVWDTHWTGDEHLVDVHIGRIRKKLGDTATDPKFIHTIRGVGYRMGTGR